MIDTLAALPVLQSGLLNSPLGKLLLVLIGIAVVLFVGRFLMSIAWRLVVVAAIIVAVLLALTTFGLL